MGAAVNQCIACGTLCGRYPGQVIAGWRLCMGCFRNGWVLEERGSFRHREVWCRPPGGEWRRARVFRGQQRRGAEFVGDVVKHIEKLEREGGED